MTRACEKSRVEFVRLTSPDERSLLAFKCWHRETCQLIHTSRHTYTPPAKGKSRDRIATAEQSATAFDRSIIRYTRVKNERVQHLHMLRAQAWLEQNVPDALGQLGGTALIETIAALSSDNENLRRTLWTTFVTNGTKQQKRREKDGDWHPSRNNVAETVMGTFIGHSLDPSALATTAYHLSEGLPERDGEREHGVRSDHVNDALYRFASDNFRFMSSRQIFAILARVGREELIADQLWKKVQAACKPWPVTSKRVQRLYDDGKLLNWAADLEETVGSPTGAQINAAHEVVLEMWIQRLEVEQKKLRGEVNPKRSRKTRVVSRSGTSNASGPF